MYATSRFRTPRLATTILLLVLAGVLGSSWQPAAAPASGSSMRVLGQVPRPCGPMQTGAVDAPRHLFLQVQLVSVLESGGQCPAGTREGVVLTTTDTRTLATWSTYLTSQHFLIDSSHITDFLIAQLAVDPVRQRIFLSYLATDPAYTAAGPAFPRPYLSVFSTATLARRPATLAAISDIELPLGAPANAIGSGQNPGGPVAGLVVGQANSPVPSGYAQLNPIGLSYDAATDTLQYVASGFVSASTSGPGAENIFVFQIFASTGKVQWAQFLDGCLYRLPLMQVTANPGNPVMRAHSPGGDKVVVGCAYVKPPVPGTLGQSTNGTADNLIGGSSLAYVTPLDANGMPRGYSSTSQGMANPYLGRPHVLGGVVDPGARRLYFASAPLPGDSGASAAGASATVFDVDHEAYIGAPTVASKDNAKGWFALAAGAGRLYGISPLGVVTVDSGTPPGQGVVHHDYSCWARNAVVDPSTRRVFVTPASECGRDANLYGADPMYWVVVEDLSPVLPEAQRVAPDSYTTQVPEGPATLSQYSAHAQATGARVRLIGGITGALDAALYGGYETALGVFQSQVQPLVPVSRPSQAQDDFNTRELTLGAIRGTSLGNYEAGADAAAALLDNTSQSNLASNGHPLPASEVACTDPGTRQQSLDLGKGTSATVSCDLPGRVVKGVSAAEPIGLTGAIASAPSAPPTPVALSLGRSSSATTVALDKERGATSHAVADSDGIELAGIRIGAVHSEVTCVAHGHGGTASCVHSRAIGAVTVGGQVLASGCSQSDGPSGSTDTCSQLLTQLNSIRPGSLIFRTPPLDTRPGYLHGSPGGYQSLATRELYRHLEDQTLNYDASPETPGLEVLFVNDSINAPSRLDIQLASVEAEGHYGITQVPPDSSPAPDAGCAPVAAAPAGVPVALAATGIGAMASSPGVSAADAAPAGGCPGAATTPLPPVMDGAIGPVVATQTRVPPNLVQQAGDLVRRFVTGVTVLLRSPGVVALVALLLLIMVAPLVLALRHRELEAVA
jgi:hypothetical protein